MPITKTRTSMFMKATAQGIEEPPRAPSRSRSSDLERCRLAARVGGLLRETACLVLLAMGLAAPGWAAVVLLHTQHASASEEEAIRNVAELYGLNINTLDVSDRSTIGVAMSELGRPGTFALLISADALSKLDRKSIQTALRRSNGSNVPVFIFGIETVDENNALSSWSGGEIRGCSPLEPNYRPQALEVGNASTLTRMLAGLRLPAVAVPECTINFEAHPTIETVLAISSEGRMHDAPVLLQTRSGAGEVFFSPKLKSLDATWIGHPNALSKAFSSVAPYILFLSYAAGSYAWHSNGQYANLTIDDPWLTQPYGHLDYYALLAEMKKHNFHTTIAFIPWNFDRSDAAVAALLRDNPKSFSICLHGNNHAHREFGDYAKNPLAQQYVDIRQGIARMERFQALTGIAYDRFMVFPHGVAPELTFAALKKYGFSGTANSSNVPLDKKFPSEPTFLLRPYTSAYGGFLSLSRSPVSADIPQVDIAIQMFMGNPLLFYGHQDLFETGAGAFNAYADFVNRVQPGTNWASLGQIARHSYLLRKREEGGFDVLMLSSEMDLANPSEKETTFYLRRTRDADVDTSLITVDGSPVALERSGETMLLRLVVPAHQVRIVRVTYGNDLDLSQTEIGKNSSYASALRMASDFRDLKLSRSWWGSALTRAYYGHNWDTLEAHLEHRWWIARVVV